MGLEQEDSQFIPGDLEVPTPESDSLEDHETRRSRFARLIRGSRGYLPGLTFVAGLLLGWLVIGWWLWPVQWVNTDPWYLRRKYQKTYISLVAENLWWTKEIHRAREALTGWDGVALTELLTTMEREASSPEARQQLAALAEALEMPTHEESLWASLLSQKGIFSSVILSALPLMVAVVLAVSTFVQNRTQQAERLLFGGEQLEEALEEILGQEEIALEGEQDQGQGEVEKEEGEEEEEREREREREEEEEYYEEEEEEEEPWMEDLVSVLFDEDETALAELEALCQQLQDFDVSDLLERSRKVADQLRRSNALRDE